MKFSLFSVVTLVLFLFSSSFCMGQDTALFLKVGTYTGKSRAAYTSEPYWGIVRLTVKNGTFTEIDFTIRDSSLHETFNEKYEKQPTGREKLHR